MSQPLKPDELLAKIAARDEAALLALYDLLAPRIFGLIRQAALDTEAAHEILTGVFARLWSEAGRLSSARKSAEVWLALRARARAVDQRRRSRRQAPRAAARLDSLPRDAKWLPDSGVAALLDERRNLLGKFIRQLPEFQARLLHMAIVQGQAEKEIAEQLGQPEGKIQTDLRAAFRFLRHRMRTVIGAWTAAI